jgi:hypothetical protein
MIKKLMIFFVVAIIGAGLLGFILVRQYYDNYYFVFEPIDQSNDSEFLVHQVDSDDDEGSDVVPLRPAPEFLVYQVDGDRKIVYEYNADRRYRVVRYYAAFLINTRYQVVVRMASVGRTCRSLPQVVLSVPYSITQTCKNLLLWPRDWLVGVPLGDGVKGKPEDSYHFGPEDVDIGYFTPNRKYALHVKL